MYSHTCALHGCHDAAVMMQSASGMSEKEVRLDHAASGDVRWEVQSLAAELCYPSEGHSHVWTRWVAVLRAGAFPLRVNGIFTRVSHRIEWAIHDTAIDQAVEERLTSGHHNSSVRGWRT